MKAVMVMFDSLNRHMLPAYGCDWVQAPNFERLAERSVTFDRCYAGSLPCVPARRELHTGRYNFLHRSWGPLEPFDDSMPELLKNNGVYTHLVTDHTHYFEDGGATYHARYNTWEFVRGQEGDHWKGQVKDPVIPESVNGAKMGDLWRQDWVNRQYMDTESKHPLARTFRQGLEFIESNKDEDRWFLQLEAFDPHEPFFTPDKYKDFYPHAYEGRHFDWPDYGKVTEQPEEVRHVIYEYASLVTMCDAYLGKVLDAFDRYNLWEDTLLIVNTDHGFLLGEKQWWGKNVQPFYNEIVHLPLFVWDPRHKKRNVRTDALVQTIDLAPTLLDFFDVKIPEKMQGQPLGPVIGAGAEIREAALFGIHGGHVNVTDGRYFYMRAPIHPDNAPLYEYTLMPAHMHKLFGVEELQTMELAEPLPFTKGCKVLQIEASTVFNPFLYGHMLFDLEKDPSQQTNLQDDALEVQLSNLMIRLMKESDAPAEQFARLGFGEGEEITGEKLKRQAKEREQWFRIDLGIGETWTPEAAMAYLAMFRPVPLARRSFVKESFIHYLKQEQIKDITEQHMILFTEQFGPLGKSMQRAVRMFAKQSN
ncbi:sulfatase [Paenibacillus oralis]|uniref:Sulfatase n=1 Tax=Paenibacillus oralis TaxID=2490856 RepID=A0A3P3TWI2_9BACL|nr:sulfatase [Paenibacillus oralis]RRJ62497.1 sulfatase [Paenibacillus oralis]